MVRIVRKINKFLNKIGLVVNGLNILIGLVISVAYVYLPFTSLIGLALGIIMAASGAVTLGISYYFTAKNIATNTDKNADTKNTEKEIIFDQPVKKNTALSTSFLCVAVPCLLINAVGSFFGMYTGTVLLASALGLSLGPVGLLVTAIALASIFTVGTLINSWLQTYNVWEGLRKDTVNHSIKLAKQPIRYKNASTQTENDFDSSYKFPLARRQKQDTSLANNNFFQPSLSKIKEESHNQSKIRKRVMTKG